MIELEQRKHELTPVEQEAHAWVRRLISGEASAADGAALRKWCAQSPDHAAAFSKASQLWNAFGAAGQMLRADEKSTRGSRRIAGAGILASRRAVMVGAVAASAAGLMIVRPPLSLWPSLSELDADYRTGTGERRQIAVMEGVSVQMDSRTSISFARGGQADGIELIAGQASFSLSRFGAKKFSVLARGGETFTSEANFDVRLKRTGVCVTCLSNSLEVEYQGRRAVLLAGQQIAYGDEGLAAPVTIDPAVVSAWQRGLIICNMTPLADVIEELNRYRSGRIVLLGSELGRTPVTGRFAIDQPDQTLTQIERAFRVRRRDLPGGIVLLS
jgi:transmembrane sensor